LCQRLSMPEGAAPQPCPGCREAPAAALLSCAGVRTSTLVHLQHPNPAGLQTVSAGVLGGRWRMPEGAGGMRGIAGGCWSNAGGVQGRS
uniref:Uncharacterized protein n=1 Tax=Anser brachyrhynchus TaxID=132585 RepID=A0A8B9I2Z4_9AVES